jgi:hypothetical protein
MFRQNSLTAHCRVFQDVCVSCLQLYEENMKVGSVLVRFQVLTATSIKMTVFWGVSPCNLVETDRCFRGVCCLQHQGDEYTVNSSETSAIFLFFKLPDYRCGASFQDTFLYFLPKLF